MVTYWEGNTQRDVTSNITLPDGTPIPQIRMHDSAPPRATYNTHTKKRKENQTPPTTPEDTDTHLFKYLGQWISPEPSGGIEATREHVRKKTISLLKFTSRLSGLTHEQMREILNAEISGT